MLICKGFSSQELISAEALGGDKGFVRREQEWPRAMNQLFGDDPKCHHLDPRIYRITNCVGCMGSCQSVGLLIYL